MPFGTTPLNISYDFMWETDPNDPSFVFAKYLPKTDRFHESPKMSTANKREPDIHQPCFFSQKKKRTIYRCFSKKKRHELSDNYCCSFTNYPWQNGVKFHEISTMVVLNHSATIAMSQVQWRPGRFDDHGGTLHCPGHTGAPVCCGHEESWDENGMFEWMFHGFEWDG